MKNGIKMTVVATIVGLASLHAWADQTNLVRNLDIALSGYQQGDSTTSKNTTTTSVTQVSLGNADIISAIGVVTGNSFSTNAQLFVITPAGSGWSTIQVRDGANKVDATGFFSQEDLTATVGKSTVNSKTGKSSGSNYSLQQFSLQDSGSYDPISLHYTLTGVTVEDFTIPAIPGPRSELKAKVSGTGDQNGEFLLLEGTIKVTGQTVEVVPGSMLPPT